MMDHAPYSVPKEPARWRAILLAVLVHALLFGLLWFGVRWQNETPVAVEAEVWSPQAMEAAPQPEPEPPKPEPKPEPPKPEPPKPEPQPKVQEPPKPAQPPEPKPDIALEQEKKKRKLQQEKEERLAQEREERLAREREERLERERELQKKLAQEKLEKEKQAKREKELAEAEQRKREAEQAKKEAEAKRKLAQAKAAEEARRKQEADTRLAEARRQDDLNRMRQQLGAGGSGEAPKAQGSRADAGYVSRVAAKIKSNTTFNVPDDLPGNPAVEYSVELLPDGSLRGLRKLKGSGGPGFDEAVRRAIERSQPYPPDKSGTVPSGFTVSHKPKDQ